jgi:hypothetical protein
MKESCRLTSLLPYDAGLKRTACLQKGLKEYQSLLRAFLEAVDCWGREEFEKFDSLVGENACQIRTVCLGLLASKSALNIPLLNKKILMALSQIDMLLQPGSIKKLVSSRLSLKALLEKEALDIALTAEEMFVLQAYLLCVMKTVKSDGKLLSSLYFIEHCDSKKYCRFGDVSTNFAAKLNNQLRKQLASASVQFVRSWACRLQDQSLMRMVSEEFTVLGNALPCIPMFWSCKTVFLAAQQQGIPLVIHVKFVEKESQGYTVVDEDCIVFQGDENTPFTEVDLSQADPDQPACVIQGIAVSENGKGFTDWRALLKETSAMDVILAGAADHRQFPAPAQDALIEALNDEEYKNYKAMAKHRGFSEENPGTFFIQHVYAASVGKILDKVLEAPEREAPYVGGKRRILLHFMPRARPFFSHGFSKMPALQPMSR